MRVGVIGAGNMGSAFARRLGGAGHDVFITSRTLDEAKRVAKTLPEHVEAVEQSQLADRVDVLIAATPFGEQVAALRGAGDLSGKTVIEISNPLTADMSGLTVGHTTSAAEEVAKALGTANVVKAFNTVFAQVLGDGLSGGARVQVFYAGDDENAKRTVRSLIDSMRFEPVDAGPLRNARYLEPLGMLNIYLGYMAKMGTDIAPAVQKVSGQAATDARSTSADVHRSRESEPDARA